MESVLQYRERVIVIGLSSIIGVPIGVMSGIFLAEFGDNRLAKLVRFFNDVFMEFPSIVLGIFAFLVIVLLLGIFPCGLARLHSH